jgi:hypothetical protein
MTGNYSKYIKYPRNLKIKLADAYPAAFNKLIVNNTRFGYNITIAYRLITESSSWIHPSHSHNFQEFLAWYGADPHNPDDFEAEVVFHLGEEMEKHIITRPTIVSLPPGLVHCPMEITRVCKPIIQIAIQLTGKKDMPVIDN